ncbi:MAG: lysylphosphatidylglycerol synthase domain-containing protein [Haloechinothrix sp.]
MTALAEKTTLPKRTRAHATGALRWLAIVVVLGFACYHLSANWSEFWDTLAGVAVSSSLLSQLMVLIAIVASTYGWQLIVNDLGRPVGYYRGAQIYLVGQLGKYVPGSVWGYLLQMELGKQAGLARARVFTGSVVHFGVAVVGATMIGSIALPVILDTTPRVLWILGLLPIGLIVLHPAVLTWCTSLVLRVLRRPALDHQLEAGTILRILGTIGVAFVFQGLHLWLLANSIGAAGLSGLALCIGAMALGMVAGTAAFFLPAGVGAREGVLVAVLMTSGFGATQALAFAAASRVMFILADLILAGGSALAARAATINDRADHER